MKKKNIGLLVFSLVLIFMVYSYWSKVQKDNWVKDPPEIKYSEAREKEVWWRILRGDDAGLYYGTPLYDLAKAMSGLIDFRNQDKIARLINKIPQEYVNYQEGKFGWTIGHFALRAGELKAIRLLLEKGLNPNLMSKSGDAIIIDINAFSYIPSEKLQTLKYMIKKGADVNLYSKDATETPLTRASRSGDLVNVKILVAAGANPHFIKELTADGRSFSYISPLETALTYRHINIVNYLIFDQKVDYRTLKYPNWSKFHPGEYEILHKLREMFFELNSKKHYEKMKLVSYLKTQGLDYWKTPIQERYRNNPNYTQDYLSKY